MNNIYIVIYSLGILHMQAIDNKVHDYYVRKSYSLMEELFIKFFKNPSIKPRELYLVIFLKDYNRKYNITHTFFEADFEKMCIR